MHPPEKSNDRFKPDRSMEDFGGCGKFCCGFLLGIPVLDAYPDGSVAQWQSVLTGRVFRSGAATHP
jgi:hypothetical protein